MGKGARTKGYIKDLDTGTIKKFLYNPSSLVSERGAEYVELSAPGISYPSYQYVGGKVRVIQLDLMLYSNSTDIEDYIDFLKGFLPNEESGRYFERPPLMLFAFGDRIDKCILESMQEEISLFQDNLTPRVALVRLSLKVVA